VSASFSGSRMKTKRERFWHAQCSLLRSSAHATVETEGKWCNAAPANALPQPQTEAGKWLLAAANFDSLHRQVPRGHALRVRRKSRCCANGVYKRTDSRLPSF
jgi:hypothetical protein